MLRTTAGRFVCRKPHQGPHSGSLTGIRLFDSVSGRRSGSERLLNDAGGSDEHDGFVVLQARTGQDRTLPSVGGVRQAVCGQFSGVPVVADDGQPTRDWSGKRQSIRDSRGAR
jgi:hypothetical protein